MTILALDPGLTTGYAVLTRNGHSLTLLECGVLGPYAGNKDGMMGREETRQELEREFSQGQGWNYPPSAVQAVALEQRREGQGAKCIPAEGAWDAAVPFASAVNAGQTWHGKPEGWFSPGQWQRAIGELVRVVPSSLKGIRAQRQAVLDLIGFDASAIKGKDAPHILDAILIGVAYAARKGWRPQGWKPARGEKGRNPLADRVREKVEAAKGGARP